jgi:uroporphyrin-III C-methyltransferase
MNGKVWLVGAGPGDPELLTVRALKVLQSAEVVIHDRLVSEQILALANPAAELLYAGKVQGPPQRWRSAGLWTRR